MIQVLQMINIKYCNLRIYLNYHILIVLFQVIKALCGALVGSLNPTVML